MLVHLQETVSLTFDPNNDLCKIQLNSQTFNYQ